MPTLLQLSITGGHNFVISSDGVWDALRFQEALNYTKGLPAEAAANQIVKVLLPIFIPGVSLVNKVCFMVLFVFIGLVFFCDLYSQVLLCRKFSLQRD